MRSAFQIHSREVLECIDDGLCRWIQRKDNESVESLVAWSQHALHVLDGITSGDDVQENSAWLLAVLRARISTLQFLRELLRVQRELFPRDTHQEKAKIVQKKTIGIHVAERDDSNPILGKNQQTVLARIRAHPGLRTRELVIQLEKEFSDRTVKRSLKDLVKAGFIRRIEEDRAVVYECVDAQE